MERGDKALLEWFEAARSGDAPALRAMVEEGFWTEARSPLDGLTALMAAATEGSDECVSLLLAEADPDARDPFGNTAAILAAAAGREGALALLVAAGADPLAVNSCGVGVAQARERRLRRQGPSVDWGA